MDRTHSSAPVLRIAVEAPDAEAAVTELLGVKGAQVLRATPETTVHRDPTILGAIAEVVAVVGGSMAIAEQLRAWYERWRKPRKAFKVVLEAADGRRLLLEDATPESIAELLNSLPPPR